MKRKKENLMKKEEKKPITTKEKNKQTNNIKETGNLYYKEDKSKKIIIRIIVIFAIILFSIIFSLINMGNDKIYSKITIQNISVANKTSNEANDDLEKIYRENQINGIKLIHNDYETTISYDQMDITANIDNAVQQAYMIGRKGNIISNNYAIIGRLFFNKNININFDIDETNLENIIEDINSKLPDAKVESTYYIDGDKLIIRKGTTGSVINKEELKSEIINKVKDLTSEDRTIEIPVEQVNPQSIDIEKILSEIKKDPQNAYLSKDPLTVHADEDGVDFDISIEDAKKMLEEEKNEYEIPLKITKASVKVSDLGEDAFPNKLATYTTNYDASNVNRNNNLMLAAEKLNGTVINPGEEFSYNKTIGQRTIEAGFKEAKAYAGGKVVLDVGGGICQLSSTLYNSALLTNLEITERHSHYFKTSYLPAGRDATVSWGSVDFKFKNNRKYPIKIIATAENGVVKVDLYGIKEDGDYTVIIDSKVTGIIESKTEYKEDKTLAKGEEITEQKGEDGCTSETYKMLLKEGVTISKTLVSKDTYNALTTIIRRNSSK